MADLSHVTRNRIQGELDERRKRGARIARRVWIGGVVLGVVFAFTWPVLLGPLALFVLIGLVTARVAGFGDPVLIAGARGELDTLRVLEGLPDGYTVFNEVVIPDERSRTGYRETDFVVVGPNGVFVVETKNYKGELEGSAQDTKWQLHKVGRGGTPYTTAVRNPVRQVRAQMFALKKHFNGVGLNPWLTPVVALAADNDTDRIDGGGVVVVPLGGLCDALVTHRGGRRTNAGVVRALLALRSQPPAEAA